jgi:hypothetical protein
MATLISEVGGHSTGRGPHCLCIPGSLLVLVEFAHGYHRIVEDVIVTSQNLLVLSFANDYAGITPLRKQLSSNCYTKGLFVLAYTEVVEVPEGVNGQEEGVDTAMVLVSLLYGWTKALTNG